MVDQRLPARSSLPWVRLGSLLCASWLGPLGCQYDLDNIYEASSSDAGGGGADAGPSSSQLINHWIGRLATVDQDCVACAEEKCALVDADCKNDPVCSAYTECVAKDPTPVGQAACRAHPTFSSWVRDVSVRDRDLTGPYGQCVFRYNCSKQCGSDADLSCLGSYSWPTTSEATVPLHLVLVDAFEQRTPLPSVTVRACAAPDIECKQPLAEGATDPTGMIHLGLPTSFSRAFTGYLEVRGKDIYPTLLKFSWNIALETTQLVGIVNQANFNFAINAIDLRPDPMRGMLQLRMLGCSQVGVTGAKFAADKTDAQSRGWYINEGLPTLTAAATDAVGSGGIIDLPSGVTTLVTATRASDAAVIASAAVPIRASFMSVVLFAPLPAQ